MKLFKTFFLSLIILLSISFTTQAKTLDHEKPNISITDHFDDGSLQITADYTNQGIEHHNQGLDILNFASCGHFASITSIGHGTYIEVNKGAFKYTNGDQVEASNSYITQNGRFHTCRLYLRRAEASGENLQGNHYKANRDHNYSKRNHYHITKPNEFFTKGILLYRAGSWHLNSGKDYNSRI